jgi:Reverse transcriptase (RNA-dependent DNA polymerase)
VELDQIDEYETFADKGKGHYPGADYKRINVHFVYAAKPDRLKARLVAGGHLTDTPIESVYSSVVSLRGIRLVAFLAELNGLQTWSNDVGDAYLESFTKEKVYIIAGPEFGDRQGHTLVIVKVLYGLKSSGLRWRERFADVLKQGNGILFVMSGTGYLDKRQGRPLRIHCRVCGRPPHRKS